MLKPGAEQSRDGKDGACRGQQADDRVEDQDDDKSKHAVAVCHRGLPPFEDRKGGQAI
jgi:hypothetical protein